MRRMLILLLLIIPFACTNKLTGKEHAVTFEYISWACECARWIEPDTFKIYSKGKLADKCVFIEPANNGLQLPDTIGYNGDFIELTGQFYANKGLPKGYLKTEEPVDDARIFRYTSYKIIRSNYRAVVHDLNLNK